MPINRFAVHLSKIGQLEAYQKLLIDQFNQSNLDNVMCKSLISVDWEGNLYDCDFNQQLGIKINGKYQNLLDLINPTVNLKNQHIETANHCFACTAGNGSSCSGALNV